MGGEEGVFRVCLSIVSSCFRSPGCLDCSGRCLLWSFGLFKVFRVAGLFGEGEGCGEEGSGGGGEGRRGEGSEEREGGGREEGNSGGCSRECFVCEMCFQVEVVGKGVVVWLGGVIVKRKEEERREGERGRGGEVCVWGGEGEREGGKGEEENCFWVGRKGIVWRASLGGGRGLGLGGCSRRGWLFRCLCFLFCFVSDVLGDRERRGVTQC